MTGRKLSSNGRNSREQASNAALLRRAGGVLVVGVLSIGGHAMAQTVPSATGQRLAFTLTGSATYDSNIAGGDAQVAQARGVSPADTTYVASATATGNFPVGQELLFFQGGVSAHEHAQNSSLNGVDYQLAGGGSARFGICETDANLGFSRQQTLPSQLVELVPQNNITQESYGLSGGCTRGHFTAGVQAQYLDVQNSAEGAGFRNSNTLNVTGNVGYVNNVSGTLRFTVQYSETNYADATAAVGSNTAIALVQGSGFQQYGAGINYSRKVGSRLSGNIGFSYFRVEPSDSTSGSFGGWSSDATLNYHFSNRLQFGLQYSRGVRASNVIGANSDLSQVLNLSGTYRMSRRITFTAGVSDSRDDYHGVPNGIPTTILGVTSDEVIGVTASASLNLGKTASVALDVGHSERKANLALFNSTSDHVGLSVTKRF